MHSQWISLKPTMALSIYDLRPTVSIYDFPDENTSCSGFSEGSCQIQTVPTWSLGLVNVADEQTLYSNQTMHIECKYKDCKMLDVNACVVYISTGEGTWNAHRLQLKTLALSIWFGAEESISYPTAGLNNQLWQKAICNLIRTRGLSWHASSPSDLSDNGTTRHLNT